MSMIALADPQIPYSIQDLVLLHILMIQQFVLLPIIIQKFFLQVILRVCVC